ncbi:hypothetical protein RSAG8_00091, partial [Rhizoctonia solani AG-8 WAC10335]
MGGRKSRSYNQ